jgi:hypothetical protein
VRRHETGARQPATRPRPAAAARGSNTLGGRKRTSRCGAAAAAVVAGVVIGANRTTVPEWHESASTIHCTPASRWLKIVCSSSSSSGPFATTSCGHQHSS